MPRTERARRRVDRGRQRSAAARRTAPRPSDPTQTRASTMAWAGGRCRGSAAGSCPTACTPRRGTRSCGGASVARVGTACLPGSSSHGEWSKLRARPVLQWAASAGCGWGSRTLQPEGEGTLPQGGSSPSAEIPTLPGGSTSTWSAFTGPSQVGVRSCRRGQSAPADPALRGAGTTAARTEAPGPERRAIPRREAPPSGPGRQGVALVSSVAATIGVAGALERSNRDPPPRPRPRPRRRARRRPRQPRPPRATRTASSPARPSRPSGARSRSR